MSKNSLCRFQEGRSEDYTSGLTSDILFNTSLAKELFLANDLKRYRVLLIQHQNQAHKSIRK